MTPGNIIPHCTFGQLTERLPVVTRLDGHRLLRGRVGRNPFTGGSHAECGLRLDSLIVRAARALATTYEVQRLLRIFLQRFRPTDFYETDRLVQCPIVGLNFQKLTFGRSDAEQEPHSGWTIIHRRTIPLFANRAIVIRRAHHAVGAGADPRPSCFPSTFRLMMLSGLRHNFIMWVLRNLKSHFPQQRFDV